MKLHHALLLLPIVGLVCLSAKANGEPGRPPNVILFLVDDMGWTDGGVFGSEYYETPNIDAFAKQAMRFTNAYAHPLCSPSRASILTGQEESRHGILSAHGHQEPEPWGAQVYQAATPTDEYLLTKSRRYLDPDATTLAEAFLGAGYRTAHMGKWHLGLTQEHWPDQHGFEVTFHSAPDPGPPGSTYFSPHGVHADGKPGAARRVGNIVDGPEGEHIDDRLGTEAIKYITEHKDEPFYLNLWMYDCHGPWEAKQDLIQKFARKESGPDGHTNPVYAAMLKTMDDNFGRVMTALDELGIADNTIVVFFSDNGGNTHSMSASEQKRKMANPKSKTYGYTKIYNDYAGLQYPTKNLGLRDGKGSLYEGGERVPLMVRWPEHIPAGSVSETIVNNIDLYPTLLELTGQAEPENHVIDGKSFAKVLTEGVEATDQTSVSYFPYHGGGISVRDGDWKFIRRYTRKPDSYDGLVELFNLKDDLAESKNLAAEMPEKVAELDQFIKAHFERTGGLPPKLNPDFQPRTTTSVGSRTPTHGLVPKQCELESIDGGIRVIAQGKNPFLGTAQVKLDGPITLRLQARGVDGKSGTGRVQWRTQKQTEFPATGQTVDFEVPESTTWQDITVQVPVEGRSQLLRLYVPATDGLDIRSIRWKAQDGKPVQWDFSTDAR
ncbi:sulfatase [Stieleria sp. ICT_E10.1]|uniref:sulfatase n=1 Tax=Stieleria sedimenti TaxID=2976331 RepID=UPI0021808380|nr:sulfatase [Stieleria sedimenti]MCS7469590.1 sulfatase [Stieleria sedimenti]